VVGELPASWRLAGAGWRLRHISKSAPGRRSARRPHLRRTAQPPAPQLRIRLSRRTIQRERL